MIKSNCARNGCKDVFRAFLVKNASFSGVFEIPGIPASHKIPNKLIPFSKCISSKEHDAWVHFYEDDVCFERIWNSPNKYIGILKRFNGVITPDFSLYRDMPLAMQIWNTYRSRALGNWFIYNGIDVIPNIRWGDKRTFDFCCNGIVKNGTIAVGTHGCIKSSLERCFFEEGLKYIVEKILPETIVVYGSAPEKIFGVYQKNGINVIQFDSMFMEAHQKVVSI